LADRASIRLKSRSADIPFGGSSKRIAPLGIDREALTFSVGEPPEVHFGHIVVLPGNLPRCLPHDYPRCTPLWSCFTVRTLQFCTLNNIERARTDYLDQPLADRPPWVVHSGIQFSPSEPCLDLVDRHFVTQTPECL
jgi:hypothetical protein